MDDEEKKSRRGHITLGCLRPQHTAAKFLYKSIFVIAKTEKITETFAAVASMYQNLGLLIEQTHFFSTSGRL